jgi:competence ComEA-like helix-hairpin-helix protein
MNRVLPVQERGLILLIGLAVLASGILLFTDRPRTTAVCTPELLRLESVSILIPRFVEVEPIDINRAGAEELTSLPGIGPALAQRIVAYREEHGPFPSIEALQQVSGIGPQTVQGILDAGTATAGGSQ